MSRPPSVPIMDRIRFIGYGLIAGIILGAIFGWFFHAWVAFIFKMILFIAAAALILGAIYFWRRVTTPPATAPRSDVRDADWVEIESSSRTRR